MDDQRLAHIGRHLRRRLGWRQSDLGHRVGLSQGEISLFERGRIAGLPVGTVRRIFAGLDAEFVPYVRWRGGDLDRLLDAGHARLCDDLARLLTVDGWEVQPEVSYSEFGERGSIDVLAFHSSLRILLVSEVKTEVASIEETFRKHDEKMRLAPKIARERFGWDVRATARLLVFPEHRTIRSQVEDKPALFGRVYPLRNVAVRRWLRAPDGSMSGTLLLPDTNEARGMRGRAARKRVRVARGGSIRVGDEPDR